MSNTPQLLCSYSLAFFLPVHSKVPFRRQDGYELIVNVAETFVHGSEHLRNARPFYFVSEFDPHANAEGIEGASRG